jgi:hypothetical protein
MKEILQAKEFNSLITLKVCKPQCLPTLFTFVDRR